MEINKLSTNYITPLSHELSNDLHGEILSPQSAMVMASIELAEIRQQALEETMEEMSLTLGSRLKDEKRGEGSNRNERSQQLLIKLIEQIQKGDGDANLLLQRSPPGQGVYVSHAQQILQTGALLTQHQDNPLRRRALSQQLAELMEDAGWEVELFGALEFGLVAAGGLNPIKRLFQQSIDEDEQSLDEWFERVSRWPDRKRRIRVLLRALAFDMATQPAPKRGRRLAAALYQLRRVLLFLGLEDHCTAVGLACGVAGEIVLNEVLAIVGQSWLFKEWLQQRLSGLEGLTEKQLPGFIRRLCELFKLMPAACFSDDDQREQIMEVLSNF